MIFPDSFECKVGFDRIRQMISEYCLCKLGRDLSETMSFEVSFDTIVHELDLTDELRKILLFEPGFPQDNYIDSTPFFEKIRTIGTYGDTEDLKDLRKSIDTLRDLERFFSGSENKEKYTIICREFSGMQYFPSVSKQLDALLDKQGQIKDNASPGLKQIRGDMKQKQSSVTRRLQSILKAVQKEGLVDSDAEITIRGGRPVIPVSASDKRKLGGIVHDESASGKTVFIEPSAIVELNNELRELEYAERREIIKILTQFADDIRPLIDDLIESYKSLGKIDFLRAKAKISIKIKGIRPILNNGSGFSWKNAIHPLLFLSHRAEGKEVIPLNIHLNEKDRILLISGPNAGGKSVCLKTVGLLQYMLQCGVLVPMSENSETCIFTSLFIDIGDEQSLENDLSTYSSHLLNMKFFARSANNETLVLIDEFGTGTEPTLGAAIAEAILEELNKQKAYGVITTHYSNLKHIASETEGLINGAMLFDTQKIQPLFKLSIGKPGSSFAIDIARKIGLPENILKAASEKIGEDHVNFEKHLREILRDKKYWEDKRGKIRRVEKTLDNLYDNYSKELEELQKDRKKILKDAQAEANEILKEANKKVERTIREIKESNADKEKTRKIREDLDTYKKEIATNDASDKLDRKLLELQKAGDKLVKHSPELKEALVNKKNQNEREKKSISKGDIVRIKDMDSIGEVLEVTEKSVIVSFGNMITSIEHSKIELTDKKGIKKTKRMSSVSNYDERRLKFKSEIDVRGLRGEEAIAKVQDFIDDALVVAVNNVRIIHGKGNGILRQLIREYLNSCNIVRSVKDEHPDKGGAGLTIVELDI